MSGPPLGRRRLLSLLAAGGATALAGCNRLFVEPDDAPTSPTPTPTATPTPTPSPTPTPAETTSTPATGVIPLRITGYDIVFETVAGDFTAADVLVGVRNTGSRRIDVVELRVALVFAPDTENRVVAVDFVGSGFDDAVEVGNGFDDVPDDAGGGDEGDGFLTPSETALMRYRTRFPSDGRADGSTDPADFALRFRVTRVEYA